MRLGDNEANARLIEHIQQIEERHRVKFSHFEQRKKDELFYYFEIIFIPDPMWEGFK